MRYLFIGAHQDDIEYSCGGTVLRLIDARSEVFIAVISNGASSLNGTLAERENEQKKAFEYSNAKRLLTLGYADGEISANAQTVGEIGKMISDIQPDVVFTHYPDDSHQDHRAVAAIVKSATRRKCSLVYYDSFSSVNFKPNLFVDITDYVPAKIKMLNLFKSQIQKYNERGIDFIGKSILTNQLNGYECNADYAEGFAVDTYMI